MKKMKRRIMSLAMALVLTVTTLFSGVSMSTAKAEESSEIVVASTPFAYGPKATESSDTYSEKGYQYATEITGNSNTVSYEEPYANKRSFIDVDLSLYDEVRFAIKGDGSGYYQIFSPITSGSFLSGNDSTWKEVRLEYQVVSDTEKKMQCYVNDEWINAYIVEDSKFSLSALSVMLGDGGKFIVTELRGKLKSETKSTLKPIKDCIVDGGTLDVTVNKPIAEGSKVTKLNTTWGWENLPDVSLDTCKQLKFFVREANNAGASFEIKQGEDDSTYKNTYTYNSWTEVMLQKNTDNTWNVKLAGVEIYNSISISNLNELKINFGQGTYYVSELLAIKEPVVPTGSTVIVSPWAYEIGNSSNEDTYEEAGYVYASKIAGGNECFAGRPFSDVDLSIYSEFKFALKSDGSNWWEVGKVDGNTFDAAANNSANWVEFKFKDEGNGHFDVYVNDVKNDKLQLTLDANLNELQMKYSSNANATLYMTEVRGTLRENANSKLKVVADSFSDKEGTVSTSELPIYQATQSTKVTFSQWENYSALKDLDLEKYNKVVFYTRRIDGASSIWFEIKKSVVTDENSPNAYENILGSKWVEIKYTRNTDETWNLHVGGSVKESNIVMNNLSEVKAKYSTGTYIFSQVFAEEKSEADTPVVPEETYAKGDVNKDKVVNVIDLVVEKKAVTKYTTNGTYDVIYDLVRDNTLDSVDLAKLRNIIATREVVIAGNPWAYNGGTADNTSLSEVLYKGYENITVIDKQSNSYSIAFMTDADLSIYQEVRFAVKSDGNTWWEICKSTDNFGDDTNIATGNTSEWIEIRLVLEGNDFRLYVGGNWTAVTFAPDINMSDLKMKYLMTGKLMITELRGELKDDSQSNVKIIKECAKDVTGTVSYTELPIYEATKSTLLTESWNHNQTLPSIDLSKYGMVKFYVKNFENTAKYLEIDDGTNKWEAVELSQNWAEVKFIINEDNTWNIYLAGQLKFENLNISNTNSIYISYGNEIKCYVSEVFAVDKSFF